MRNRMMQLVAPMAVASLMLATLAVPAPAQGDQTGTESFMSCVDVAEGAFDKCVDDSNWIGDALCVLRLAADVVLCIPSILLSGGEK